MPFEDLPVIYNLGELFVFPSLYEGFGLPVVEAMASGTPVLTANTSSLVEIAGDGAETVDPLNTEALGDAIYGLLTDEPRRRDLAERGWHRSRAFSWSQTAQGHAGGVSARRRQDRRRARRHHRRGVFMIALDRAATLAFDRLAPVYDSLACGDAFLHQRRQTHAAFGRWLRPGCRVLEIGCGTGADTEFLARAGLPVVACDPSEEMLSRTKRRLSDAGVAGRVGILACGLQQLPRVSRRAGSRARLRRASSRTSARSTAPNHWRRWETWRRGTSGPAARCCLA